MHTMAPSPSNRSPATAGAPQRLFFRAAAALGVLWNAFGIYQFAASFGASADALVAGGMTSAQATLYLSLPAWMNTVFAVGVFSGMIGSLALAALRKVALPAFAVSLAGYSLLFAGDAWFGLFAAIPGQLVILSVVMLIAISLLVTTLLARRSGWLR